MYHLKSDYTLNPEDISLMINKRITCSKVEPLKCINLGYSEVVEFIEGKFNSLKNLKELMKSQPIAITIDSLNQSLTTSYTTTFYEMNELFSEFNLKLSKKNLFVNDVYCMSVIAAKRHEEDLDYKLSILSKEIIPSSVDFKLGDNITESKIINSNEIYDDRFYDLHAGEHYDFILFQSYISSRMDAADEYKYFESLFSKVINGMMLQSKGGTLVIKLMSVKHKLTAKLIHLLSLNYERISIFKPKILNATKEQYLVMEKFQQNEGEINKVQEQLFILLEKCSNIHDMYLIDIFVNMDINKATMKFIFDYNCVYNENLVEYMNKYIKLSHNNAFTNTIDLKQLKNEYIKKYF